MAIPAARSSPSLQRIALSAAFLLVLAAYVSPLLLYQLGAGPRLIPSADVLPNALLPLSLLKDGDFYLDEFRGFFAGLWGSRPPFAPEVAGHLVSKYPVATPLIALPFYAPAVWLGLASTPEDALVVSRLAAVGLTLATLALWWASASHLAGPARATALTLALALGTSLWTTASQGLWQHTAALPFIAAAALLLFRGEAQPCLLPWAGLCLGIATATRYPDGVLLVILGAFVALRHRASFPGFAALAALPMLGLLVYNWAILGSVFATGYGEEGLSGWRPGPGVFGLLVSPSKGLLVFSPFLAVALVESLRRLRAPRSIWFALSISCWSFTLLLGSWWGWYGGWSYGTRMLTDILPTWGLFLVPATLAWSWRRWTIFTAAVVGSVAIQALGLGDYGSTWHARYDAGLEVAWLWSVADSPLAFYGGSAIQSLAELVRSVVP